MPKPWIAAGLLLLFMSATSVYSEDEERHIEMLLSSPEYRDRLKEPAERDYLRVFVFAVDPIEMGTTALVNRMDEMEVERLKQLDQLGDEMLATSSLERIRKARHVMQVVHVKHSEWEAPEFQLATDGDYDVLLFDAPVYRKSFVTWLTGSPPDAMYASWIAASDRNVVTDPLQVRLLEPHHRVGVALLKGRIAVATPDMVALAHAPLLRTGYPGDTGMELHNIPGRKVLAVHPSVNRFEVVALADRVGEKGGHDLVIEPLRTRSRPPMAPSTVDAATKYLTRIRGQRELSHITCDPFQNCLFGHSSDGAIKVQVPLMGSEEYTALAAVARQYTSAYRLISSVLLDRYDPAFSTRLGKRSADEVADLVVGSSFKAVEACERLYVFHQEFSSGGLAVRSLSLSDLAGSGHVRIPTQSAYVLDFEILVSGNRIVVFTTECDEVDHLGPDCVWFRSYSCEQEGLNWSQDGDWWQSVSPDEPRPTYKAMAKDGLTYLYVVWGRVEAKPVIEIVVIL